MTNLNYMYIRWAIGRVAKGVLVQGEFGEVQCTFPGLETAFIEIGLDVTFFDARDKLLVIMAGAVFCHELSTNVEDLSTGHGQISDGEFVK